MDTTAEKLEHMMKLVKTDNPLARAFAEDENVREQSRKRSARYLTMVESEKSHIPEWMWGALWFILGMFFWESVPAFVDLGRFVAKSQGWLP